MWAAGGFDSGNVNSPSQFSSPSVQQRARRSQNLVATTARKILNTTTDSIMIAGTEVHMVSIVGLIKSIDIQSTKITYVIDDSTAEIDAVQWLETDNELSMKNQPNLMEMTYCKIAGGLRTQQGKKHLIIYKIHAVTNLNQLTTHLLEVLHDPLKIEFVQNMKSGDASNTDVHMDNISGQTGQSMNAGNQGLQGPPKMIYELVRMGKSESGINRSDIYTAMQGKVQPRKIDEILEMLSSEGLLYTTFDDDTFKTTDG